MTRDKSSGRACPLQLNITRYIFAHTHAQSPAGADPMPALATNRGLSGVCIRYS